MSDDPDVESRIDTFLARYTPEIAAQLREARARLRAAFPRGVEMVYDNYNALVFGIGAGERRSDAFTQRPRRPSPAVRGHDHPPAQDSREEGIRLRRARTGRPPRGAGSASDRGGSR